MTFVTACTRLFSIDVVPQLGFKFQDNGDTERHPKSFLAIWDPVPRSRPHRLCIPGGAALRRCSRILVLAMLRWAPGTSTEDI